MFVPIGSTIEEVEKAYLLQVLGTITALGGNKVQVAKSLGITVKTLYNKLHKYGFTFNEGDKK